MCPPKPVSSQVTKLITATPADMGVLGDYCDKRAPLGWRHLLVLTHLHKGDGHHDSRQGKQDGWDQHDHGSPNIDSKESNSRQPATAE